MRTIIRKDWKTFLVFSWLISCLIGCAGTHRVYKGPPLPGESVAHLTNENNKLIRLVAIDGQYGPHGKVHGYCSFWDSYFKVEILPGEHDLTLLVLGNVSKFLAARSQEVKIGMKVEPGQTYFFKAETDLAQSTFKVVVMDKTGKNTILDEGPFVVRIWDIRGGGMSSGGFNIPQDKMDRIIRDQIRDMSGKGGGGKRK